MRLTLADGEEVTGDELLVAAGRRPRTAGLGLEAFGLQAGEPVPFDREQQRKRLKVAERELAMLGKVNPLAL